MVFFKNKSKNVDISFCLQVYIGQKETVRKKDLDKIESEEKQSAGVRIASLCSLFWGDDVYLHSFSTYSPRPKALHIEIVKTKDTEIDAMTGM